jgi:cellulose biosynthesis protein BcsQ
VRILATYSIKGGVGKTATAVNLAYLSAKGGARTLLWDLDPQGAASFYFRIKPKVKGGGKRLIRGKVPIDPQIRGSDFEDLDLLPADFSYRNLDLALSETKKPERRLAKLLSPFADEYDVLFIDCPPSISVVSESVFHAADALLVPTIPTHLSLRTLEQLLKHLSKKGPKGLSVLPFFCMVDRRKALHRRIADGEDAPDGRFLDTRIPYSSIVERMGDHRAPLATWAGRSRASKSFEELWAEIRRLLPVEGAGR